MPQNVSIFILVFEFCFYLHPLVSTRNVDSNILITEQHCEDLYFSYEKLEV